MANTYTLIASYLGSGTTITFSSISQNYTDLVIKTSARKSSTAGGINLGIRFNGDTGANYSKTRLSTELTAVESNRTTGDAYVLVEWGIQSFVTNYSQTFGNQEIYIPSYTVAQHKPVFNFNVVELPTSTNYRANVTAGLWRSTDAITSITLVGNIGGGLFGSESTFYLYGIKNS